MGESSWTRRCGHALALVALRQPAFWQRPWKHRAGRIMIYFAIVYISILVLLLALEVFSLYGPRVTIGSASRPRFPPSASFFMATRSAAASPRIWPASGRIGESSSLPPLRSISALVLLGMSTSTAKSGARPRIGS